jgi:hypothetical protein
MTQEDKMMNRPEEDSFSVGEFRPADAQAMVTLFQSVYGDHYPIRTFYNPKSIIASNTDGGIYSIVARTPSGRIIGATNLFRSEVYENLYEWGAGLVLKEYRNLGVNASLADFLHNQFVASKPDIEELFGEPVCNHTHLQRSCNTFRYLETGIEVALMPAEAYTMEKSAKGRVATLSVFRCCLSRPHRVFLPCDYEDILRCIYGRLDDEREIFLSEELPPEALPTESRISVYESAGVARMFFSQAGKDFAVRLEGLEDVAREKKSTVFQVFLNLSQPWVGKTVRVLRERGYFFGSLLPRWFDGDGLMMQKLDCPPDFENIKLLSDFSKSLLEGIHNDWKRANAERSG